VVRLIVIAGAIAARYVPVDAQRQQVAYAAVKITRGLVVRMGTLTFFNASFGRCNEQRRGKSSRDPRAHLPILLWIVLGVAALAGMSGTLTLIGLLMFVVPGLVLLAAPTAFLYALLAKGLLAVWSATRSWAAALTASTAMLTFVCAPGLVVNLRLAGQAAAVTRDDFGELPKLAPVQSLGIISREHECGPLCTQLLEQGVAREIHYRPFDPTLADLSDGLGPGASYRVSSPTVCALEGGLDASSGEDCILRTKVAASSPEVIVVEFPPVLSPRRYAGRALVERWNPLSLGTWSYRPLEAWTCRSGRCTHVMRRTEIRQRRLNVPLWIGTDGGGGGSLVMWREWGRREFSRNNFDLVGTLHTAAGLPTRTLSERRYHHHSTAIEAAEGDRSTKRGER
jgi:hypothetical protein